MNKLFFSIFFICIIPLYSYSVSLEKMISEMIVVGFDGQKSNDKWVLQIKRDIRKNRIGGIYLSKKNIDNNKNLKNLINEFQTVSNEKLFIISRPSNFGKFNSDSKNITFEELDKNRENVYRYISDIGVNVLFWPNADLKTKNSYSIDVDIELSYLDNEFRLLQRFALLPVLGHFPGKIVEDKEWEYEELKPFYKFIKNKMINAIMMDNGINTFIDEQNEATFSELTIKKLLKNKMGFDGIVFSSDLKSYSLSKKYTLKERVVKALNAGVDVLFFSGYFINTSNVPNEVKKVIKKALKEGLLQKEQIVESYYKIIGIKGKLK